MVAMAVVLVGTSAVTFSYASDKTVAPPTMNQGEQFNQGNNQNDFKNDGENPLENFGEKSNQSGSSDRPTPPNMNGNSDGKSSATPPSDNQQDSQSDSQQGNQPPEMPDSNQQDNDSSDSSSANGKGTSASGDELNVIDTARPMQREFGGHSDIISVLCYLFGALQIGIIVMILVYLAFSEFNKLSFSQTVSKFRK